MKNTYFGKIAFLALLAATLFPAVSFTQILGWDTTGQSGFGVSPFQPATQNVHVSTSGLIRGSAITASGNAAASCWGGSGGWGTAPADANSFYVTFQANPGYSISLSEISSATRRSNAGPNTCVVWYSVGGAAPVSIGSWSTSSTSGTSGTPNSLSLSSIEALQDVPDTSLIKIYLVPQGGATNYYLTGGANSLRIEGAVEVAADPLITPSVTTLADFGEIIVGNTSDSQSFLIDAEGLTSELTILAPAGFEISTDGLSWFAGTDLELPGGTVQNMQIWVRFHPTVAGVASGEIQLMAEGAETKTIAVTGTGMAEGIAVTPTIINTLFYQEGQGPSASVQLQHLSASGLDPASGDITFALAPESNYELSTDGVSWSGAIAIPYETAEINISNPPVFVRLKAGLSAGNIALEQVDVSAGGSTVQFALAGMVITQTISLSQSLCEFSTIAQLETPQAADWFDVPSAGEALTETTLLESGTYYLELDPESAVRVPVSVEIIGLPEAPAAVAQTLCEGSLVENLETTTGESIRWYLTETGGEALLPDTVLQSQTYYASQQTGECESLRTAVAIVLNPTPEQPLPQDQEFCGGATVADLVPAPSTGSGGDAIVETWEGFIAYGHNGQQTMNGTGISYNFADFVQTPTSVPTMTSIETNTTFADLKSITIYAAAPSDAPSGTNKKLYFWKIVGSVQTPLPTLDLTNDLAYYTIDISGLGENARIKIVRDWSMTVFQMESLQFNFYQEGDGLQWFDDQFASQPLQPEDILTSGTYYLSDRSGDCESGRTPVEILIYPTGQPLGESSQEFTEGQTLADLVVEGDNLVWFGNPELSGEPLELTTPLADATTYYVVSQTGTCISEVLAITVEQVLNTAEFAADGFSIYPNPVRDVLWISTASPVSSVFIFDVSGKAVLSLTPAGNEFAIDVSGLANGVYFAKIQTDGAVKTMRIAKQ